MEMKNKYVHEAYSAIFQQDFKRAIDSFQKAIKLQPRNHSLYYKLSITYARNYNLEEAIEAIKKAIQLADQNQSYALHLQALECRKVADDARKALEDENEVEPYIGRLLTCIELDPLQLELKWILAMIYIYQENYKKADEQVSEILNVDPEHEHALEYYKSRSELNNDVN